MTKTCFTCGRMIHNNDPIIIVAESVFHDIPSSTVYAIDPPSECYELYHVYCRPVKEME